MAFQRNSTVNRLTPNTVATMKRNAAAQRCPVCGRKSAMRFIRNWGGEGIHFSYCVWAERTPPLCKNKEIRGLEADFAADLKRKEQP